MGVARYIFILFFIASGVSYGQGNPLTAKQILEKMVSAMEKSTYQGTVVFLKNDKLEAMKYFHTVDKDRQQERLVSLNSPMREIIRNSDEVKCLYKMTRQVIVDHRPYEHSFIVDVPKNLTELESSYRFDIVGDEDIAMLPAYVVAIQPKDDFRYIRKIWIGKDRYLPLKAVVYDLSGVILEQVVFTEIQINKEAAGKLASSEVVTNIKKETKEESPTQTAFEMSALPQGFKQIFYARKPLHEDGQLVDHLLLSDGFASVSVYLEAKKDGDTTESGLPEGIHSVGAVNSMSRSLADSQLTVLGEVPATTVKYIAEGVKLRQPAH